MLCWASVSRCFIGKCQTLTYQILQMLGCGTIDLPSTKQIVSNCLCGISTRQLELVFRRAGPTVQHLPLNVYLTWLQ